MQLNNFCSTQSNDDNFASQYTNTTPTEIASNLSKTLNERANRANNIMIFNLKEFDEKTKDEESVNELCTFIVEKDINFKYSRLGKKEPEKSRPIKVEFSDTLSKNEFMGNLKKLKNAPTHFKNISVKHNMSLDERKIEKELYSKAKDMNTKNHTQSKNEFFVIRVPIWNRKIVKVKKKQKIAVQ